MGWPKRDILEASGAKIISIFGLYVAFYRRAKCSLSPVQIFLFLSEYD